ncbi:AMP-binding protein [Achromobacter spanius]|uniref:AMP-binding protein n=1 Tax=Achromobacter spanius TaxID=217203 RepID=UPI0036E47A1D
MAIDTRTLTIGSAVRSAAERFGDRTAVTFLGSGTTLAYSELHRRSNSIARGLAAAGICSGMHVALFLDNSSEQLLAYAALGKLGAVAVPLNTAARGAMLRYYLEQSDAEAIIVLADYLPAISETIGDLSQIKVVLQIPGALEAPVQKVGQAHVENFADLYGFPDSDLQSTVTYKDLALLMYTSGTTGPSKANMFSHAHMLWYALEQVQYHKITSTDVVYVTLPLFHANGLLSSTLGSVLAGAHAVVAPRFSASRFWVDIAEHGATLTGLLGSMSNILLKRPRTADDAKNSLRAVVMIPAGEAAKEFSERFATTIYSGYGLTDYSLATAFNDDDPPHKLGTSGRPRENIEIRIVDDDDFDLPRGQPGEILLRAKTPWRTACGYYKMPEATLEALRNGWFHTGDLGYLDQDGYLNFFGRKKDSIRRRGENISSYEVELVVRKLPEVADVAVFGVPSMISDEEVAACVVLREGAALSEDGLATFCLANMPYFMVPRYIRFAAELPRNMSEKVVKSLLVEDAKKDLASYRDMESVIAKARLVTL